MSERLSEHEARKIFLEHLERCKRAVEGGYGDSREFSTSKGWRTNVRRSLKLEIMFTEAHIQDVVMETKMELFLSRDTDKDDYIKSEGRYKIQEMKAELERLKRQLRMLK